jgi:hypothetical protein
MNISHETYVKKIYSIEIVGSGDKKILSQSDGTHRIYCNSAILRSPESGSIIDCLIISDGLIMKSEEIYNQPPLGGFQFDVEKSYKMRINKVKSIKYRNVDFLLVVSNRSRDYVIERLTILGIKYSSLKIINHISLARMLVSVMKLETFKYLLTQNLSDLIKFLLIWLGIFRSKKIPFLLRPSTGVVALLYTRIRLPSIKILLNGVGFSAESYYATEGPNLDLVNIQGHPIDKFLITDTLR